jgi:hypothetical protein
MAQFPKTPCMQNKSISLEAHQAKIDQAVDDLRSLQEAGAAEDALQPAREAINALRLEHHPDHWFIDPGSGHDTEDGRLRRRAIQACWADCPMKARLLCLDRGLQPGPTLQYGIYGGYTEKERQKIAEDIEKRKTRTP